MVTLEVHNERCRKEGDALQTGCARTTERIQYFPILCPSNHSDNAFMSQGTIRGENMVARYAYKTLTKLYYNSTRYHHSQTWITTQPWLTHLSSNEQVSGITGLVCQSTEVFVCNTIRVIFGLSEQEPFRNYIHFNDK